MRLSRIIIVVIVAAALVSGALAVSAKKRTSADVKREKQKTEKQIAKTKRQIAENDRETGRQLDRLTTIKAAMSRRSDTIAMLSSRLDSVGRAIRVMNDSISGLEAREQLLKDNYGRTLRRIRSHRQGMNDLSFVFSSESFGQAWRRMRYLGEIAKTSPRQARQLAYAKAEVDSAKRSLEELQRSQSAALSHQRTVQATLRTEQASADNLVKNLKRQGKSLQRELEKRSRQAKSLEQELNRIVEQEIREAEERRKREEAERKRREAEEKARKDASGAKAPGTKPEKGTGEKPSAKFESESEKDRKLSGSFASNKGRLLFPVAGKYTIVSKFGTNELSELSKVKVDNLGIDIEVPKGAYARSVFEGVVSSVFRLEGYNYIVIVRHGEYLSVYAGIDSLSVKKGDKVTAGHRLGTVHNVAGDDYSRLHFEIRHEKEKLNPSEWVK